MGQVLGLDCVFGYKVGGIAAVGDFIELGNIRDASATLEHSEADATTRANQGWRATVAALKDLSIDFQLVYDNGDTGFQAFRDAFFSREKIAIAMLDGPLTTGEGLVFDSQVMNFTMGQPLEEVSLVDITLKPTYSPANPPEFVEDGVNTPP